MFYVLTEKLCLSRVSSNHPQERSRPRKDVYVRQKYNLDVNSASLGYMICGKSNGLALPGDHCRYRKRGQRAQDMFFWCPCMAINVSVQYKTISYGAGNSKFLKTEIGWISDFGRTSASQQKIVLWDSGN